MKDPYATEKSDRRLAAEEEVLRRFVTDNRWERMQHVLDQRSRYITVAVEDIYQPHNGSAVLRSCDAFGVQDVHIIENRNRYQVNPGVELGTAQWLSLYRYRAPAEAVSPEGTVEAVRALRRAGYRIVATTPHRDDVDVEGLSLADGPVAIFFGAEKEGLSNTILDTADEYLRIPMRGFVESLNISVSAAVCLNRLGDRLRTEGLPWGLSGEERRRILNRWLFRSVKNAGLILERELPDEPLREGPPETTL
jgi:tRNA (guanosine-2'-O-)-methyltransferase